MKMYKLYRTKSVQTAIHCRKELVGNVRANYYWKINNFFFIVTIYISISFIVQYCMCHVTVEFIICAKKEIIIKAIRRIYFHHRRWSMFFAEFFHFSFHFSEVESFCSTYNPDVYVVVYSVVDRRSFKAAEETLLYLWKSDYMATRGVILVGNKVDLERKREVPSVGEYRRIFVQISQRNYNSRTVSMKSRERIWVNQIFN